MAVRAVLLPDPSPRARVKMSAIVNIGLFQDVVVRGPARVLAWQPVVVPASLILAQWQDG
jgi:hypothetical protein